MKYRILSTTEKELYGANVAVTVDYADLIATGGTTSGSVNIAPYSGTLAAGNLVSLVGMVLNTPFVGSDSPTTCAVTVGDAGSASRYLASTELLGSASYVSYSAGTGTRYALTSAGYIIAAFTDTSKSLQNLTAGSVTFFLRVDDLTALPVP